MTTTNDTARSGKTESLEEVLTRMQRMWVRDRFYLMCEDWDWLVVLQCMQDHRLFKSNPQRPPFAAFSKWLTEHNIPQHLAHCSVRTMSYANNMIDGARYPWTGVEWQPHVLKRWKILYRHLSCRLEKASDNKDIA